ncbi:MAG: PhoH family protein [Bacteroidales bacterium]|nr:PhoH family protein [Bacteroidales bacterium]
MIEKTLYLEGIDPVDFFGINNVRFDKIRHNFPKLKISARGDEIKVNGDEPEILLFQYKIEALISHINTYKDISLEEIDDLMSMNSIKKDIIEKNDILLYGDNGKPIKAQTVNQKGLVKECVKNDLLLAIGPAGTGKTYTAIALAVRALKMKEVKRIILTRPAVESGERLGFLPGDYKEKLDPYLQPLYDALNDMIPLKKLKALIEEGIIQIAPLAYMRGRTLDNAFVILDEGQNATGNQLKMFLTRIGRNAKFIVTGDVTQIDLPRKKDSGLLIAESILKDIDGISIVRFDDRDILRHKLVKYIVDAYKKHGDKEN